MATIKGQNLRVFLENDDEDVLAIAAATSATVHIQMNFGDSTTKDSEDDFQEQEPVGMAWDVQCEALVISPRGVNDDMADFRVDDLVVGQKYNLTFAKAGGDLNREIESGNDVLLTGVAVLSDLAVNAPNRADSTYQATFTGVGELELLPNQNAQEVEGEHGGQTE